jgi:hypothetical protein
MRERRTYGTVRGLWREPLVCSTGHTKEGKVDDRDSGGTKK